MGTITHSKVSAKSDSSDPTKVNASDWNAAHTLAPGSIGTADLATIVPPVAGAYTNADITLDATGRVIGAASGAGGTPSTGLSGTIKHVAVFTGAGATAGNGQITDDGTSIVLPNLCLPYTDLGTLAAGNNDLDLTGHATSYFKVTPNLAGSNIRSIKTASTVAGTAQGQVIGFFNAGGSTLPGDYLLMFNQDDGSGMYQHVHLEGRQPWHSVPALSVITLRYDDVTLKWHIREPLDFSSHPRPIPITFSLGNGNNNDILPVDSTTGLNGRYAQWFRIIAGTSTNLVGIEGSAPTGGSNWSRRILLSNYGSGTMTIVHNNGGGGTSTYPFFCPGSANFSLPVFGCVWCVFDEGNRVWILEHN